MSETFIFGIDKERGIWKEGSFTEDGRLHVKVFQKIPDSFFRDVKAIREASAIRKRSTQEHWAQLPILPHVVAEEYFKDGNGKQLALNDPERDKRWKRLQNDIDYRDLRVWEGKL